MKLQVSRTVTAFSMFPLELVDIILSEVPTDDETKSKWTFAACTLVCKSWQPFGQSHLFRTMTIRMVADQSVCKPFSIDSAKQHIRDPEQVLQFFSDCPGIAAAVRELTIVMNEPTRLEYPGYTFQNTLACLSRLRKLHLVVLVLGSPIPPPHTSVDAGLHLETLCIDVRASAFSEEIAPIIGLFSSLSTLEIRGVGLAPVTIVGQASLFPARAAPHTLILNDATLLESFLNTLQDVGATDNVRSLCLRNIAVGDTRAVSRLLAANQTHLTHLELGLRTWHTDLPDDLFHLNLMSVLRPSEFRMLHTLVLRDLVKALLPISYPVPPMGYMEIPAAVWERQMDVISFFSQCAAPLRRVTFEMHAHDPELFSAEIMPELIRSGFDLEGALLTFQELRTVTFIFLSEWRPEELPNVAQYFPPLHERDILRVEWSVLLVYCPLWWILIEL
ncbi:hypothetical protein NM688_g9377 [Phlebia brevispora]|uniref:Uncharacterized protein n=1 Tax=Phlebia brevispora TaxID=194682 RepID=A0ACC1RH06_9APHY|nr:hypothetical protein NM688_g9377 [Phlebia brevispora]